MLCKLFWNQSVDIKVDVLLFNFKVAINPYLVARKYSHLYIKSIRRSYPRVMVNVLKLKQNIF